MKKSPVAIFFILIDTIAVALPVLILGYLVFSLVKQPSLIVVDIFLSSNAGQTWKMLRNIDYLFTNFGFLAVGLTTFITKKRQPIVINSINFLVGGMILTTFSYALVSVFFSIILGFLSYAS